MASMPSLTWWSVEGLSTPTHDRGSPRAYNVLMTYDIICPSAPEENETTTDLDRAMLLCLDLSEEFGYAEIRDAFGNIVGDYGDPSTFLV